MEEGGVQPGRCRILGKGWVVMAKGEALIRDIAKLFAKYGLSDWAVVIRLLQKGGPEYVQIAQAIEEISTKRARGVTQPKRSKSERTLTVDDGVDPDRIELLGKIYNDVSRYDRA